jgi:regulator of sigma E protease
VDIIRNGSPKTLQVQLESQVVQDKFGERAVVGRLGVAGGPRDFVRLSLYEAFPAAIVQTVRLTGTMIDVLGQIITGQRSVKELGGPLKIAQVAGQQASLGLFQFVVLVALMSINLGFINLLPVPMLDGGHLLFYGVEAVRRRPVSARTMDWAFRGGLAAILTLLLFTTTNDLGSFGVWERLGRLIG